MLKENFDAVCGLHYSFIQFILLISFDSFIHTQKYFVSVVSYLIELLDTHRRIEIVRKHNFLLWSDQILRAWDQKNNV